MPTKYTRSSITESLMSYSTEELTRLQLSIKRGMLGHGTHCNPDCICHTKDMALDVIDSLLSQRAEGGEHHANDWI